MKTRLSILVFLFSLTAFCCDNCSVYLNINPNDNSHSVGINYRYRLMMGEYSLAGQQLMTKHTAHGSNQSFWGNQVREHFNTYELRGKFQIGNRFRTYLILPFVHNIQTIGSESSIGVGGLGDPTLLTSFQLIDPTKVLKHEDLMVRIEMGGGLKIPLGKTDKQVNESTPNLDLQAGTGSFDALFLVRHTLKFKRLGYTIMANYKVNGFKRESYKYGNVFNGTFNLFHQTKLGEFTLMPVTGGAIEIASLDESTVLHEDTGGRTTFLGAGLYLFWKKFQLFGEIQKAVSNKFNGYTQLINKHSINFGLTYNF